MFDFFEQPYTLMGASVLVLFGLLTFRSVLPEKRRWWQWLIPAALVGAAFGLDAIVQTEPEQINVTIQAGVKAVEARSIDGISRIISDDYSDSLHGTKGRMLFYCRQALSQNKVVKTKTKGVKLMELSQASATAVVFTQIVFDQNSYVAQNYKPSLLIKTRIDFKKRPDAGWLVSRIELKGLDGQSITWRQVR